VPGVDVAAFRSQFPVCAEKAYLNAGTCGPLPHAATDAMTAIAEHALLEGRALGYYHELIATVARLRARYAALLGAAEDEVSVTTSTSEGIVRVLLGLDLAAGDEVLIAEHEHPGLLGPLAAARERLGIVVREVPLAQIADAVSPATRLIACSHVGWSTGEHVPALAGVPADVPVLLDGAQGVGAIGFKAAALGCAFYAGSGQKWLCGPVGTGMLWVAPAWRERLRAAGPTYMNLEVPADGIAARAWADGRGLDAGSMSLEAAAGAIAALDVLGAFGFDALHERARTLAARLAEQLGAAGREVAPRGDTTLVSWVSPDAEAEATRLGEAGIVVRSFHGLPYVRASVGAWNDQSDVDRLVAAASSD
jgi:L-cysteine/cystine lyase